MPSRCLQVLVGEHVQRPTQLTLESYHRTNTYYASINKVLSELELRFSGNDQEILCALKNICHSETTDKGSFSRGAKSYKNRRRDSGSRVENVGEFSSCARIRLLDDCFRNAGDNAREWSIWYVFRVFLFGTYPCSDACYIAFCTTIIHCFAQIENLPPQHMEQQRVGNSALINIERAYANSVVIDLINDIFHRQNCRSWFLLTCFMNPYDRFMFMCKNIFTSHEGLC